MNASITDCGQTLNPHLPSPQASQKCRLLAWSSAKQNGLLSHHQHKAIKPSAICTQFKNWLNWTLTGHSIPLEQFGRWDYGYRSTATLQTADVVQVSQPTAITANHLQTQWTEKTPADSRPVTEIRLTAYAVSSLFTATSLVRFGEYSNKLYCLHEQYYLQIKVCPVMRCAPALFWLSV